jgi:hypothetical protein
MGEIGSKSFGRYVPISSSGEVKLYLPLEKCAQLQQLRDCGYEVAGESRGLVKLVELINEAAARRAESEEKKHRYIAESLADFSRQAQSINVVCPYCLGTINSNWPSQVGEVLCGWYDEATRKCDGDASYFIDRAHLVLGLPEVEVYTCHRKGTSLDLSVYDLARLREEIERRSETIGAEARGRGTPAHDAELARILPLRICLHRTRESFKELVCRLMEKDAIVWVNTLSLEELESLLDRATGPDLSSSG